MSRPVNVHHVIDGPTEAPVVVLSNSLGTSLDMWNAQVPELAQYLRVLRYDHRGHGRSPVPRGPYSIDDLGHDVIALLDRLGLERVRCCGQSLGGMVAMWLAATAPERVERLVLCCTSAHLPPREDWLTRARVVREHGVGAVAETVLDRWFTRETRASDSRTMEEFSRMLRSTPPEGYASCCEAIANVDLRDRLTAIRAPSVVIAGDADPATPREHAEFITQTLPVARLRLVRGAAHMANVERPEAVTRTLLAHLGAADGGIATIPGRIRGQGSEP